MVFRIGVDCLFIVMVDFNVNGWLFCLSLIFSFVILVFIVVWLKLVIELFSVRVIVIVLLCIVEL